MTIAAYAPDLMDGSKLRAHGVRLVRSLAELATVEASMVIVDLTRPGVLEVIARLAAPVVGYGPHVDTALLDAGRAAGCAAVLPRSRLFARLPEILATERATDHEEPDA